MVAPRAALAQGIASPSGNRFDPYAPQYAPPTATPASATPAQGRPSQIGLPPVPNLSGQPIDPQPPAAPPAMSQPQAPSYYQQPAAQPAYAPYAAAPPAGVPQPNNSPRYPLGAVQQTPPQPPAGAIPASPLPPATPPTFPPETFPTAPQPPVQTAPPQVALPQAVPPQPGPPQPGAAAMDSADDVDVSEAELFEPTKTVAIVGDQWILWGDVLPTVNQYLAPAYAKAQSKAEIAQIDAARDKLARQVLDQMINNKLMYLEFLRELEKKAGKAAEDAKADMNRNIRGKFDEELLSMQQKVLTATPEEIESFQKKDPYIPRLALLMKEHNLLTLAQLDAKLRETGSSLEKQRRAWGEYHIGRVGISQKINFNPEVTHQEMIDYYKEHAAEFAVKAKARFEILTVRFDRFPNKEAAWQAIAAMGNEVFFGAPFAAVAKKGSQEPNAAQGGQYDWTSRGSLASEVIDHAIFTLEVGKLSQILEDDKGFHIVRVIERTEDGQIPFVEAQKKIKEAIVNAKKEKEIRAYTSSLRTKTPVWTIYDSPAEVADAPGARSNLAPR